MMAGSWVGVASVSSSCTSSVLLHPSGAPLTSLASTLSSSSSSSASSSSFWVKNHPHHSSLSLCLKASAPGIPSELSEDPKFVPLNAEDPEFGPPALLLLGFELDEAKKIQQLLKELDGEFMEIKFCTEDMITRSLWEAMNTKQPNLESVKIAKSLPRICFLSGLSGEEMMMFIDAFPETGLEPAVFAALVPNSADKPLQELMEEIMGDHEMLTQHPSS